jgi:hypothetical protein
VPTVCPPLHDVMMPLILNGARQPPYDFQVGQKLEVREWSAWELCAAGLLVFLILFLAGEATPVQVRATDRRPGVNWTKIDRKAHRGKTADAASEDAGRASAPQTNQALLVTVVDENNVAVPSARVTLAGAGGRTVLRGETDYAGRCQFKALARGAYELRVAKEGFYDVTEKEVRVGETGRAEVTLNHQREFSESVNVVYSPPAIDPAKTTSSQELTSSEIINLPYTVTRDIRYALPLLPGVLQDAFGQLHVNGSRTSQIVDQLDGYNITDSGTGAFDMRVSVDAVRSVDVESSRYPAEFGKGSGGVVSLNTGMGDDRYRFSGTDFIPSLQNRRGLHLNTWTPRGTFSGPLRKGKAWFLLTPEGEYDVQVFKELPPGADRNYVWRFGNLAKAQVNWKPAQILTGTFLINRLGSPNSGLTRFDPLETTVNLRESAYLLGVKNQSFFSNGMLLEVGFGASQFRVDGRPQGSQPFVIRPEGTRGNYFETSQRRAARQQFIASVVLPAARRFGRHELKLGADLDRISSEESLARNPFVILREDGTRVRAVSFIGGSVFEKNNFEAGAYAQDRWSLSDRLLVEPGVRLDRDQVTRHPVLSPRLASSTMLTRDGETKLTWGVGLYYDPSILEFLSPPRTGRRLDQFYDSTGQNRVGPPVVTSFSLDERALKQPRFVNWSLGLERRLPSSVYLRTEFVEKRSRDGWTYINQGASNTSRPSGLFVFENVRRDRYHALEVTARRRFKGNHTVFAAYTRSAAHSNAVLNFAPDAPLFSQQVGGPLAWDAPNRFQSWGWLPLGWVPRMKGFDFAYSMDWRDGFPFYLVNQELELVAPPGARRFPQYFSLNTFLERRVLFLGYQWALRVGFNDITNRHNPTAVNNNIDSPQFLAFGGLEGRALTARIRLLGRK